MASVSPAKSDKTCTECGRVFTKAAHLLRHVRSHVHEKPFSCSVCGKAFGRTDALQRHERTLHSAKRQRTSRSSLSEEPNDQSLSSSTSRLSADIRPSESVPAGGLLPGGVEIPEATDMSQSAPLFPPAQQLSGAGNIPHFPPPSFLSGFPAARAPSTSLDLDRLVGEWLSQDGGDLVTENALAMMFSDQGDADQGVLFGGDMFALQHSWPSGFATVIPSMQFLDGCLHLYFREFHPTFPIIHRPTFQRERTSALLLLTRDSGLWIYERLHYVIIVTRDAKMQDAEMRLDVNLSALLGQCFSFLHGKPKHMLTAESFHALLCTMARRNGLSGTLKSNPISYANVEHLDSVRLKRKWREWGHQETLRRLSLGLTIHAAELTIFSGLARLMTTRVSRDDAFSDALFEANDSETWRTLLRASEQGQLSAVQVGLGSLSSTPETFYPTVRLAQAIVNVYKVRELVSLPHQGGIPWRTVTHFYDDMVPVALDCGVLPVSAHPGGADIATHTRSISALWHFVCATRLSPMGLIEEAAGRGGSPMAESVLEIQTWAGSPAARLATIHCAYVLHYTADLRDVSFLIPRAIFQSTLLLLCFLSFSPQVESRGVVDVLQVNEWTKLAYICDSGKSQGGSREVDQMSQFWSELPLETPAQRFVADGDFTIQVRGFLDGREKLLDIVRRVVLASAADLSLRSTSNRLLRRCTPWGIGDTLGDILSGVSF
ncbi:uncharacterized protein CcaverHIS019_0600080 [Cutaneotrichosporon cavernicola]|uniref:C2H2-type domain-containing protein n=1 Tax=Cutaneotrichosporon cavernicola TaxID=279322 RepID=A0AA48L7T3_9TREE|nr:uncharacterized protein CcaverHIS019_0600080 [Cutaneotrichosporon cavernicola]BEI93549.1 hypothetical protein CcaverHIS019_0600080 [Cutaneotrichosporon cavernicola]